MDRVELLPDLGNFLYTIVSFVIALSIIVTVHEYGHYIIGRWSGIKADVFSLGFGPTLVSRVDRHGTRWQIAALPFGGYVKFRGDANAASAKGDEAELAALTPEELRQTMHGAPLWARAATVVAGPVFNFILSIAVIAGLMLYTGTPTDKPVVGELYALPDGTGQLQTGDEILAVAGKSTPDYPSFNEALADAPEGAQLPLQVARDGQVLEIEGPQLFPPRLTGVAPKSASYAAGLVEGDVITAVDGNPIWTFEDLRQAVSSSKGKPLDLTVWHAATRTTSQMVLTPKRTDVPSVDGGFETRWMIGATGGFIFEPLTRPTGLGEALTGAVSQTWGIVTQSVSGLSNMILGNISSCNLQGAIGIAQGSAAAAKSGLENFIWFIALLSTAVGFLNLFPIPVLDGGHLMFYCYEAIAGKPPSDRIMNVLMSIGVALVFGLMLFGLSNDILCP
ncbi:RIP metalloprotease RseP [Thioclava sp. 'Guangxiensis']|uniref:RIP metalloprotease RseP n=1 Tax=Thioclava sp. 'Guangxiensis' TaxID=3149044 RepID=UPI0038778F5D